MSARLAAIPPAFLKVNSGKTFYLSLNDSDLGTPSLRYHLGILANILETNSEDTEIIDRSFSEVFQHLSTSNATAHRFLRKFRDDFYNRGKSIQRRRNETSTIESNVSGGISNTNTITRRKRTRTLRRRTTKVSNATMDEIHDNTKTCENTRTSGICETTTPTMVQLRPESRKLRKLCKTTTIHKETITKNSE